jgi:predicted CXXCH cytochrome family protein
MQNATGNRRLQVLKRPTASSSISALATHVSKWMPMRRLPFPPPTPRRQRPARRPHFLDNFRPELLRAGLYHPDGQQLDEVYVYGSMLQSRMYRQGVRCTDCHDAHSLKLKAEGNAVCVQCHNLAGNPRFPTLRKAGLRHPGASSSHRRQSAGHRVPEPVTCRKRTTWSCTPAPTTVSASRAPTSHRKLGTPNACNQCHANKSPAWAAEAVARWYGPERRLEPGFATTFAAARAGRREALPGLLALLRDPAQPAIVRATATEHLPPAQPEARIALSEALNDSDALVRAYAVLALAELPPAERAPLLVPCLRDPIRLVRINAAQALAALPPGTLAGADQAAFDQAYQEYLDAQAAMADMPATQLNLAGVHAQRGDDPAAREAYSRALRMDPDFGAGRNAYAGYLATRGDTAAAEATLRAGLERNPGDAELRYSLALLLAESGQLPAAIRELHEAARRAPDNRAHRLQPRPRPDAGRPSA